MTKLVFLAFMAMAVAFGEAATINVGGTTGWAIPPSTEFYDDWEKNQNITVGDTLVFNFVQGAHDVARVTESAYNSCDLTSPIFTQTSPPFSFVINDTSDYYFICTFGVHCTRGQKLAITNVKASSTTTPSSSPPTVSGPTSSATSPPPPPNSAQSLASASFLVAVAVAVAIAISVAFFD